jgi:hypothetical protein
MANNFWQNPNQIIDIPRAKASFIHDFCYVKLELVQ